MSAYTQNYVYRVGEKLPNAKENIISQEKLKNACESASKYMYKDSNEFRKKADKQ